LPIKRRLRPFHLLISSSCAILYFFKLSSQIFCSFQFSLIPLLSILLKLTKDGNDSDGLGDAHPALWEAKLTKADEPWIRLECYVPKFVKIRFDTEKKGIVVRSDCHKVYMYETMFRVGFRLPFLPMVRELLDYLDLALHQLVPNAWRVFHACMVLWPLALGKEHQLTVREFLHLHQVHKNLRGSGVYNFQTKRGKLIQLEPKYSSN
jgi:hypothetical protein